MYDILWEDFRTCSNVWDQHRVEFQLHSCGTFHLTGQISAVFLNLLLTIASDRTPRHCISEENDFIYFDGARRALGSTSIAGFPWVDLAVDGSQVHKDTSQ